MSITTVDRQEIKRWSSFIATEYEPEITFFFLKKKKHPTQLKCNNLQGKVKDSFILSGM